MVSELLRVTQLISNRQGFTQMVCFLESLPPLSFLCALNHFLTQPPVTLLKSCLP